MQAQFFVENATIAFALKNADGKIWDEDNEKVCVKDITRASQGQEEGQGQGLAWSQGSDFLVLTQPLLCFLQIPIIVNPSDAPQSVQKELKSEKEEQIKVMQTQDKLYIYIQTHLFFSNLFSPFTTSDSEPLNPMGWWEGAVQWIC